MLDEATLAWPFFDEAHRELASRLSDAADRLDDGHGGDVDAACRSLVRSLGQSGLLKLCVGTDGRAPDVRSLALAREALARRSGLADFAFAMQGLGSGAITLSGSSEQRGEYLGAVASGEAIAAFAMTEPEAGSDAASIAMTARPDGADYRLDGEKTYISNGGIADIYTVLARTGEPGPRGLSMFIVRADDPGLQVVERIEVIAPHPLARLRFDGVRADLIGTSGEGFAIAMRTLNLFRVTVGAAALGFARRALDEALRFAVGRRLGAGTLADNAVTQANLAEMALAIDASSLLIYRAAWQQDVGNQDVRSAAAMAKLHATENAQRVIDMAVQMHGGSGVQVGTKVESLYRDIRALRIYEGATEVQQLIIGKSVLRE